MLFSLVDFLSFLLYIFPITDKREIMMVHGWEGEEQNPFLIYSYSEQANEWGGDVGMAHSYTVIAQTRTDTLQNCFMIDLAIYS